MKTFLFAVCVPGHVHVNTFYTTTYTTFCNLIGLEQWDFSLIWNTYMWKLPTFCGYKRIIAFVRDIWHKYHSWYFKIVSNFTRLTTREITYNNFEVSPVVVMPNITPNHVLLPIQIMRSSYFFTWINYLHLQSPWCILTIKVI